MRKMALILILIFSLIQTGCWDAREIDELGFVLSIALDKTNNGFKVTAQIASPENYSKTGTGGSSQKSKPFWIISSTGKTIFEAIRSMASISSRRIFWSHIKVIVISDQLGVKNTHEVFDFFSRNPELRLRTLVSVTPDEAGKIIQLVPVMEKDPATYLERIIENENLTGKSYKIMLKDFLEDYLDPNVGPVTSKLNIDILKSEPVVKTSGAYVFKNGELYNTLNEKETRGLLWIKNKMKGSIMVVNCPYDNMPITLEIKNTKSSIKSNLDNDIPNFTIAVKVNASITEQGCSTDFSDMKKLNNLEKALEADISSDIQSSITASKNMQVDFPGFSRTFHSQHKNEWHQINSQWNNMYKKININIAVNAEIYHVALAKPLEPIK